MTESEQRMKQLKEEINDGYSHDRLIHERQEQLRHGMDLIDIIIDQNQIDPASLRLFIDHIEIKLTDEQEPGVENIEVKVVLQAPFQSHDALYEDLIDCTKDLVQKEDATAVALQKNQMIEQVIA